MGSSHTKDESIDLYMHVDKQYYIAGEYVEGEVYLNAKTTRQYSNLCLKLTGVEHVYWSEGSGKNRRSYSNTYKNYDIHQLMVDFHGTVQQGQYSFPFSILLPAMMSGSFFYSQSCYIKYMLRVELVHPTEQKETQYYQFQLNILEPPRMPLGAVTITNTTNSKCCGCCADYGTTSVTLNCDKNFVLNGDNLQINGLINNEKGTQKIQRFNISLLQQITMVSSGGRTRNLFPASYALLSNVNQIPAGGSRDFNFVATVPQNIVNYTAIGRVTSRFYVLYLQTQYGCCANTASAMIHLIVHSRTPMIVQKRNMPPPQNWFPKVYPKINCQNMKPFMYSPLPQITFLNMPGNQNVIINTQPDSHGYGNYSQGYEMKNDFVPQINQALYTNYQPTYYKQDIFTQQEQQLQGYRGYQPYFANENTESTLVRKL